jgi:hypothetical protein
VKRESITLHITRVAIERARSTIVKITEHGVTERAHVGSDLVKATRLDATRHKAHPRALALKAQRTS